MSKEITLYLEIFSKMSLAPKSGDPGICHQGTGDFFYFKQPSDKTTNFNFIETAEE
jgi:hypothetical protein